MEEIDDKLAGYRRELFSAMSQAMEERSQSEGDCVFLGEAPAFLQGEAALEIVGKWVAYADSKRSEHAFGSTGYAQWMDVRLLTFEEYRLLFEPNLGADFIRNHPAFEFLLVRYEEQRRVFVSDFSNDLKGYWELIGRFRHVPVADFFFSRRYGIRVPNADLQQHAYLTGRTGSGKTELLKVLFDELYRQLDSALVLLDPHGDLAEQLAKLDCHLELPGRLVYIDPFLSEERTPVVNPFSDPPKDERTLELLTSEIARILTELVDASLSLQMEAVLVPCVAALLRKGDSGLHELQRFMDDGHNRDLVALGARSPNPAHRAFFRQAFVSHGYRTTKLSIYTKLQSLLNSPVFYRLTHGRNSVDFEQAVENRQAVIVNLSQGKMGVEAAQVFGKLVIALLQGVALKRAFQPQEERVPTYLFIDELQNFLSESVEKIVSETRKYGFHLIMANQNLAQIANVKLREAILGNTRVKIAGENSPKTLKTLGEEMGFKAEDFQTLEKHHFLLKVGTGEPAAFKADLEPYRSACMSEEEWVDCRQSPESILFQEDSLPMILCSPCRMFSGKNFS